MTAQSFAKFCEALIGTWTGEREGNGPINEKVKSVWERALGNAFLQEHWFVSDRETAPGLHAVAYFKIGDDSPEEFFAAYKTGKFGCGNSSFRDGEWVLTHDWFQATGKAEIRLRFLDSDTYQQEVVEINETGAPRLLTKAILKRGQASPPHLPATQASEGTRPTPLDRPRARA
jgi:hypothetical protein